MIEYVAGSKLWTATITGVGYGGVILSLCGWISAVLGALSAIVVFGLWIYKSINTVKMARLERQIKELEIERLKDKSTKFHIGNE